MARIQGRLGALAVSTDGGTNYTPIYGLVDATLNGTQSEVKTTAHGDGGNETYIVGRHDYTIDGKVHYDEADAGQGVVATMFFAQTTGLFKFTLQTGAGHKQGICSGFPSKLNYAQPNDDAAGFDFTIRLSGALTWTDQA